MPFRDLEEDAPCFRYGWHLRLLKHCCECAWNIRVLDEVMSSECEFYSNGRLSARCHEDVPLAIVVPNVLLRCFR